MRPKLRALGVDALLPHLPLPRPHRPVPFMKRALILRLRPRSATLVTGWLACVAIAASTVSAQAPDLAPVHPATVGLDPLRLERVTEALNGYVETDRLPGGVLLVLREGGVAYTHAFGYRDREARDPMESDDLFRIASQTKAIVSVAIMMLQEDGELLIGDRLSKYLPAFARTTVAEPTEGGGYQVVEAERPITIRDLLTHTAGLGYGGGAGSDRWAEAGITGWYFAHRDEPIRATVERMATLPFPAQPGSGFVYGYSTDVLGAVVEAVSGQSLESFLKGRIFEPLGMADTHFFVPNGKRDRLAVVYNQTSALERAPDGPGMQTQGEYLTGPRTSFSGGAGLVSTAHDYGRFLQMMLNEGRLGETRLLSPHTVRLMTTDHIGSQYGAAGMGFGLGFSVREDVGLTGVPGSEGEFGWGGAYHSTYWVDPAEEMVVVYLTQVIPARGLDDHQRIRALLYASILAPASVGND